MPDEAPVPQAPVPPIADPYSAPPIASPGTPAVGESAQPQRRSRWWIWLIVLGVLFLCTIAACAPIALLFSDTGSMAPFAAVNGAVAVIPIDGAIQGIGGAGEVTPSDFLDKLNQAENDPRVRAIVLRVDSGGGTVAASEEIASFVKNTEKPVIVSVGDICASGAYMISSQADEIWAVEGSSVGSIGVILEIPNVEGLLDKLGISFNTITAGENKDTGSPFRELTPEERERLQGQVDEVYEQFIRIVAEGRDMPEAEVRELATGWLWTGAEARELGLVDEIGTYEDALLAAAEAGGIEGEPEIITYEDPFADLFGGLSGLAGQISPYGRVDQLPGEALPK